MIQITSIRMKCAVLTIILAASDLCSLTQSYLSFAFSEVRWIGMNESDKTCNSFHSLGIICKVAIFTERLGEQSSSMIKIYGNSFLTQTYVL